MNLRHQHFLAGEGPKICQICQRIVVRNCQREGVGVKNYENLTTSNGWSPRLLEMQDIHLQ